MVLGNFYVTIFYTPSGGVQQVVIVDSLDLQVEVSDMRTLVKNPQAAVDWGTDNLGQLFTRAFNQMQADEVESVMCVLKDRPQDVRVSLHFNGVFTATETAPGLPVDLSEVRVTL